MAYVAPVPPAANIPTAQVVESPENASAPSRLPTVERPAIVGPVPIRANPSTLLSSSSATIARSSPPRSFVADSDQLSGQTAFEAADESGRDLLTSAQSPLSEQQSPMLRAAISASPMPPVPTSEMLADFAVGQPSSVSPSPPVSPTISSPPAQVLVDPPSDRLLPDLQHKELAPSSLPSSSAPGPQAKPSGTTERHRAAAKAIFSSLSAARMAQKQSSQGVSRSSSIGPSLPLAAAESVPEATISERLDSQKSQSTKDFGKGFSSPVRSSTQAAAPGKSSPALKINAQGVANKEIPRTINGSVKPIVSSAAPVVAAAVSSDEELGSVGSTLELGSVVSVRKVKVMDSYGSTRADGPAKPDAFVATAKSKTQNGVHPIVRTTVDESARPVASTLPQKGIIASNEAPTVAVALDLTAEKPSEAVASTELAQMNGIAVSDQAASAVGAVLSTVSQIESPTSSSPRNEPSTVAKTPQATRGEHTTSATASKTSTSVSIRAPTKSALRSPTIKKPEDAIRRQAGMDAANSLLPSAVSKTVHISEPLLSESALTPSSKSTAAAESIPLERFTSLDIAPSPLLDAFIVAHEAANGKKKKKSQRKSVTIAEDPVEAVNQALEMDLDINDDASEGTSSKPPSKNARTIPPDFGMDISMNEDAMHYDDAFEDMPNFTPVMDFPDAASPDITNSDSEPLGRRKLRPWEEGDMVDADTPLEHTNPLGIMQPQMLLRRNNALTTWSSRVVPGTALDLMPELDKLWDGGIYRYVLRMTEEVSRAMSGLKAKADESNGSPIGTK